MNAVMAGWMVGYAMGVVTTIALTFLAFRMQTSGIVARLTEGGMSPALLAVPIFTGAVVAWSMAGLIAGSIYELGELGAGPDFFGSPSAGFTVGVLVVAWMPLVPLVVFSPRHWLVWVTTAVSFAALFGWLLPLLAER